MESKSKSDKTYYIEKADKIRREFHQLIKENGVSLETECCLKTVSYLDITFVYSTDTSQS